jgi:hypothetical protein
LAKEFRLGMLAARCMYYAMLQGQLITSGGVDPR